MKKIESFKSFSQLQNQIREEAKLKEVAAKRDTTVSEFNALLQKYNASSVADLNEEDKEAFMAELTKEGNAFGAARAEAIAKGDDKFEVDGEEVPVKDVDAEDEENAEEFVAEAELSLKANPKLYKKVEDKLKGQKYNSDAEYHLTLLKSMNPKKLSKSDLDTLNDFDDLYEAVNEGLKREAGKVATAWKKVMKVINAPEERSINVIAKVYALAMGDANFHREAHTSKAIGSQTTPGVKTDFDRFASDIASAAGWGGIYIAQGTLAYLKAIGEDKIAARFEKKINKEDDLHESIAILEGSIIEGNAFSTARLKAIEAGEEEFEFDGKTYPLTKVDKEDKEAAEDLVDESNKTIDVGTFGNDKLGYNDQFRGATSLAKTLASELGFDANKPWTEGIGFDDKSMYAIGGKEGTISNKALTGKYTYADLLAMAKDFLGINESEDNNETVVIDEKVGQDVHRMVNTFITKMADKYDITLQDAVYNVMDVLRSQNYEGLSEGRAFIAAARKAKDEGLEEFEYDGKNFPVLLKEEEDLIIEKLSSKEEKEVKDFLKNAEGKRVSLTTSEFDGTSTVEDIFKFKASSGLHSVDYMSFDFDEEIKTLKTSEGNVELINKDEFTWNIGGPRHGSTFSIKVL